MNDTVQKLMELADEYADERRLGFSQEDVQAKRQALQDELTKLFTPLSDEQIRRIDYQMADTVGSNYKTIARAVEQAHGIGETK